MNPYSYQWHEMAQLALAPARAMSGITKLWFTNPANPFAHTHMGRNVAASAEMFERLTRRYGKPAFGIDRVKIAGKSVPVHETVIWQRAFCRLLHFERELEPNSEVQPKLLLVAPMSGHYATLLRGTVETFLPHYDVYITDWTNARMVPVGLGSFGLDDYIDYLIEMCRVLSADYDGIPLHTVAVCQPAVPLLAAVSVMEARGDPHIPASMTLMGGPIDTRRSPTTVNILAETRGSAWFHDNCIYAVPYPYPGASRNVYPGFLQLSGFMAMNIDRHVNAHIEMFNHLVEEDGDSAERHREFYDEYLSVMDLDAEFYLQTVDAVFVEHRLPEGKLRFRGERVDPSAIRHVALMTVEGANDDISGIGQTQAAHDLCPNIPAKLKIHYMQKNVGHYGVFNGSRFREQVAPRIMAFHVQTTQTTKTPAEPALLGLS